MRLGIGSYTFTWAVGVPGYPPDRPLTALDLLDKAVALDVHLVQVCDNLPLDRLAPRELDAFATRAAELGIAVEVGARGFTPEYRHTQLRLAQRFGSPILRAIAGTDDHNPDEDEIVRIIREMLPELEGCGVCLALENYERLDAKTWARIAERVGSRYVGICLDTANSLGSLDGLETVVQALGPWTINLHVKDFAIRRAGHKMGFSVEGRPVGQGQLNIPWLLETLRALGRDPNAILELWTPPETTLADTIAKEAAWAASSVAYLRTLIPRGDTDENNSE